MSVNYHFDLTLIFLAWTFILLIGVAAAFLCRKRSAAFLHGIWCAVVVALTVFPLLNPWLPPLFTTETSDASPLESLLFRSGPDTPSGSDAALPMSVKLGNDLLNALNSNPNIPETKTTASNESREVVFRWGNSVVRSETGLSPGFFFLLALFGIYVFGMGVMFLRLIAAHGTAFRWIRQARPVELPEISERTRRLAGRIGVSGRLRLLKHPDATVPFNVSVRIPTIILPEDFTDRPSDELEDILAHEIAHIARRDLFWQLLVQWIGIPLWPHPLFWYARHRMRVEQERACDDIVLKTTLGESHGVERYAETLVELAASLKDRQFQAPAIALPIARSGSVTDRVTRLLNSTLDHRPLKRTTKAALVLLGIALLALGIMSLRRPDEAQRLYAIAVPENTSRIVVRGRVLLPDGSAPKECYVGLNYKTYQKRGDEFFISPRCNSWGGGSAGKRVEKDGVFEFEADPGSLGVLTATTSSWVGQSNTTQHLGNDLKRKTVYVMPPYPFSPSKEDGEIVLKLEPATYLSGVLYYENGEPATRTPVSTVYYYTPARGADIPRIKNESFVSSNAVTNDRGEFEFPLWPGEFILSAGGTPWSPPVTKTVFVTKGEDITETLTIPTPLRINVELPDGTPARDFQMVHLGTFHPSPDSSWQEVFFDRLYESRMWENDPEYAFPKQPTAVSLSPGENYLAVMTGDNRFGIVRRIEPEMTGRNLTLTLRPTIPGKARLLSNKTQQPLANRDVTLMARIMFAEYNGSYTVRTGSFGRAIHFQTDADGNMEFLAPVFEGECAGMSLAFEEGKQINTNGGRTHRLPNWLPRKPYDYLYDFKTDTGKESFDLGDVEMER